MSYLSGFVISIKKYLLADRRGEESLGQLCRLLLEGMEQFAPEDASEEFAQLRASTRSVLAAMDEGAAPADLLEPGIRAAEALKNYHRHVVEQAQRPAAELRAKVKLLTEALTSVSASGSENIRRLQEIRDNVLTVMDVKQLRTLRVRLSECLDGILAEAQRQRTETVRAAEAMNHRPAPAGAAEDVKPAPDEVDPATGLPSRDQAEEALAQACQNEDIAFVVVMVLNRIQAINLSFGEHTGNAILGRFSGFVRHQLPTVDQVFRWSGPAVVALVRRTSTDRVRSEIDALMAHKLEFMVSTPTRTVQLPITARWTILPLAASPRLLFHKIDGFADFDDTRVPPPATKSSPAPETPTRS
jgi:GGDEF domain-containing protein